MKTEMEEKGAVPHLLVAMETNQGRLGVTPPPPHTHTRWRELWERGGRVSSYRWIRLAGNPNPALRFLRPGARRLKRAHVRSRSVLAAAAVQR